MDTGSFKGRTSHFSWYCLLAHPFQAGRLIFGLMALIATESALALCPDPPNPPDAKCCRYYTSLDPSSVNIEVVGDMAQCMRNAAPYADTIAVSPGVGCVLPGQGVFNDPIPPLFASDPWVQNGTIWYLPAPGRVECTGPGRGTGIGLPVLLTWRGTLCTLSVTGPGGTDGAMADVEPSRLIGGLRAETLCNGVPTPRDITLTLTPVDNSGGHNHIHGRPTGSLFPASGTTPLTFAYTAPAVSGDYTITAKCADDSCGEATEKVWVGVKGLIPIPPIPDLLPHATYQLHESNGQPIGRTNIHPENHYLTLDAVNKLWSLGFRYSAIEFPNYPLLHVNDASLVRGGLFDLDANWRPKHHEHRRGTVVDVRANGGPGSIPVDSAVHRTFEIIVRRLGADAEIHGDGTNQHYHVRLRGVRE